MLSEPSEREYWDARVEAHGADSPQELYFKSDLWRQYDGNVRAFLRDFVTPGAKVLDLGCGFGLYAGLVESFGASWSGVDFCDGMRDLWQTRGGGHGTFHVWDVRDANGLLKIVGQHDVVMLGCIRRILGVTPDQMRDRYLPLTRYVLGNIEASECHVWDVYGNLVTWRPT